MTKANPTNPFSRDEGHVKREVPSPISKAKVVGVDDHPERDGFHTVEIRVYGEPDEQTFRAPVIAPHKGDVTIPERGDDVAVLFGADDKPWIIGFWYALDRARDENDTIDVPEYDEGDRLIGNGTGSYLSIREDGTIEIITSETQPINLDRQDAIAYLGHAQTIPGDDQYYQVEYDVAEDNVEGIFRPSTHDMKVLHDGAYEIDASIEFSAPGQNNRFSIAVFINGVEEKRKSRQSATNEELSLDVGLNKILDEGDVVDIRIRQNSGSGKDLNGTSVTSDFTLERSGI